MPTLPDSRDLNGIFVNGRRVRWMTATAVRAVGTMFLFAEFPDGRLLATGYDGIPLTSEELRGAKLDSTLDDNATIPFRVDSVDMDAVPGIALYFLSFFDGRNWNLACGTDPTGTYAPPGQPIPAVALSAVYNLTSGNAFLDSSRFTFSCVNAALGACLLWGYRSWARQTECLSSGDPADCTEQDLFYAHHACSRLARADYCGNGMSHTVSGTAVAAYDAFGLRQRPEVSGFGLEADWRADGAHCVRFTRFRKADPMQNPEFATDVDYLAYQCPIRLAENDPSCVDPATSHFYTQNGYADPLPARSILRSETVMH